MVNPKLNKFQKSLVVIDVVVNSYWKLNEERVRSWVEDRMDSISDDADPDFDTFVEEFPFSTGWDEPTLSVMLNELLNFIDLDGYCVIRAINNKFQERFEAIVEEEMRNRESQAREYAEFKLYA